MQTILWGVSKLASSTKGTGLSKFSGFARPFAPIGPRWGNLNVLSFLSSVTTPKYYSFGVSTLIWNFIFLGIMPIYPGGSSRIPHSVMIFKVPIEG